MAWPCFKWSPDIGDGHDARYRTPDLLGEFYIVENFKRRWVRNYSHLTIDRKITILAGMDGFSAFDKVTLRLLAGSSTTHVKRIIDLWRGIEDCIILSTPEKVGRPLESFTWKLWKWVIKSAVYSVDNVTNYWKEFANHLKMLCASRKPKPLPLGFPGRRKDGSLGTVWYDYLPWLALSLISSNKIYIERMAHLATSRSLPAPALTRKRLEKEFSDYRRVLTRDVPINEDYSELLRLIAKRLGRMLNSSESGAHLSLNASASFHYPRSEGGKAIEVADSYIRHFVRELPSKEEEYDGFTIFGSRYLVRENIPKLYTMCRWFPLLPERSQVFLKSDFEYRYSTPWENPAAYKIEEAIFGLDNMAGYQLLQHCIEEGIRRDHLSILPYRSGYQSYGQVNLANPPMVRAEVIGEPGNKVRWISVAEGWESTVLQPLAHEFATLLRTHPSLKSGFARTWRGWDWANDIAKMPDGDSDEDLYFMCFDLSGASDRIRHEYARSVLDGFLEGTGRRNQYFELAIELLTGPKLFIHNDKSFVSSSGVLMGYPGTKECLMLLNACIRYAALLMYPSPRLDIALAKRRLRWSHETILRLNNIYWDIGVVAGDDCGEVGPLGFLHLVIMCQQLADHEINLFKTLISRRMVVYCEEFLFFQEKQWRYKENLFSCPYEEHIHVDAMKLRVLSPCGKDTMVAGSDYENPVVGKGQAFMRKMEWLPRFWVNYRQNLIQRWTFRMSRYIGDYDPWMYLPLELGGVGLPHSYSPETLLQDMHDSYPYWIHACARLIDGSAAPWLRKLARTVSSGGVVRGFEVSLREEVHAQYVFMAEMVNKVIDTTQLLDIADVPEKERKLLDKPTIRRIARMHGYITEADLDLTIERAWLAKTAYQAAWYGDPVVGKFRIEPKRIIESIETIVRNDSRLEIPKGPKDYTIVLGYLRNPPSTKLGYGIGKFLHRDVISRHFSQYHTEFPPYGPEEEPVARGSIRDVL